MSFKQFFLKENIKEAEPLVQQGKLSQDVLDRIIEIDPSSDKIERKKLIGWMARQWVAGQVSDFDVLRNTIEEWYSFNNKQKTKHKQIYGYKTFADLKSEVDYLNQTGEGLSVSDFENDYEVVRDDEELLVIVPHTHEASRKLGLSHFAFRDCEGGGKDSAWCTTYKAADHFNDYYYSPYHIITFYYVKVRSEALRQRLEENGYGIEYTVVAISVPESKHNDMEAYDGLDKKFTGQKLDNYLSIINLR